jgi:hypothetical protein
MDVKLNIVLECYSINPILERKNRFIWLGVDNPPRLEINNSIKFIMINIKKLKLALDDNILKQHKLQFPFTYDNFITFARRLASSLTKSSTSWLKSLEYMKDYILAPLMVSSKEVHIGIIILDELILKPILKPSDILESENHLSQIKSKTKNITTNANTTNANAEVEWKCDMLSGILEMSGKKLSEQMKLYIMNCRGYIPPVLIHRMPNKFKATSFFRKQYVSFNRF